MDEQRVEQMGPAPATGASQLKRRGMLAGAAALVGAALAKWTAQPVAAGIDGDLVMNTTGNNGTLTTGINGVVNNNPCFQIVNTGTNGGAIFALSGSQFGIQATSGNFIPGFPNVGVIGTGGAGNSPPDNGGTPRGGYGTAVNGIGVHGNSTNNFGILGESTNSTGVIGRATGASNPQPGVLGAATNGYGVFGFSQNSNGIAGQSGTSAAGCVGFAGAPGGYGIYGGTAVAGGYAGGFAGPVLVNGAFTVVNGPKNAAVPHPDGSHRLLYCQESPEPWFEDFGEGKLVSGRAQVTFDPDFVAVVHNDKYLVFPVPEGDCRGLYVSDKSPTGFEIRELQGGTSSLTFSYRVVARRKDIPGPRLEKVKLPEPLKELVKPELPKVPEPPKAPERPGR